MGCRKDFIGLPRALWTVCYPCGREGLLQALVPRFCEVKKKSQRLLDRSLPQLFWKIGVVFLVSVALWAVFLWKLPQWSLVLLIPVVLGVGEHLSARHRGNLRLLYQGIHPAGGTVQSHPVSSPWGETLDSQPETVRSP